MRISSMTELCSSQSYETLPTNVITEEDSCLSCGQICEDKYILDCGQQPFCNNCSENILSKDNRDCPECNQRVSIRIKMRRQTKNT